jgi:FimV-like protein
LILVFYGGYRLSLPEYYKLAVLTQSEQKNLSPGTRGAPSAFRSEFALGAEALLSASRNKWGIIPYFDLQQVMQAITHLQNAFAQTADPVCRNKYAFYLGKAYLMQEDVAAARQWLNKVLASAAVAYQDEAKKLLDRLPPN